MAETARLGLPLIEAHQAQKHVTVNEALGRLDVTCQLALLSRSVTTPPAAPDEGDAYLVPAGAVNAWAGQEGRIAAWGNGGWLFLDPGPGWRGFVLDEGARLVFAGGAWLAGAVSVSAHGAATGFHVLELDHAVAPGGSSLVAGAIPARAILFGVTARVVETLGDAGSWSLGNDAGSADRFGAGAGMAAGSWLQGELGVPTTYYGGGDLLLSASGGSFTGGVVRLALHYALLGLPGA